MREMLHFIKHYYKAKTKYQVDSPFVFDFMSEVLEDDRHFYAFDRMETFYFWLEHYQEEISWKKSKIAVKEVFRQLKVEDTTGQLFFRIALHYQYKNIASLGDGLSGVWMAQAFANSHLLLVEEEFDWVNILKQYCDDQSWDFEVAIENQWNREINNLVKKPTIDALIINSIPTKNEIDVTFEEILPYLKPEGVVIINHKNRINYDIWTALVKHPQVKLTLDLFEVGLLFFQNDQAETKHFQIIDKSWKPWSLGIFK